MPLCRSLGGSLWEIRSALRGNKTARLLFCTHNGEVFVLHGFVKKTAKTPKHDMELARSRMKEVTS
jgi:phage-related protein